MKLATSTSDFRGYANSISDGVRLFQGTGFKYLDLSLYTPDLFTSKDELLRKCHDAADTAAKLGMKFVQAHAPDGEHFIPGEARDTLIRNTKMSIACCGELGIENIVVHPAPMKDVTYAKFLSSNLEFLRELFPVMEKYNVNVLIENGPEQHAPFHFIFSNGHDMKYMLEYANHPLLHAVWDTGHANMRKMDQYGAIVALGDDLRALHIADNAGERDEHTAPFFGNCNFDSILQALVDINYKGYFTFECGSVLKRPGGWPISRDPWIHNGKTVNTLLDVPLHLKKEMVSFVYQVGKYMLEQYNLFEE